MTSQLTKISVEVEVQAPLEKTWKLWTTPSDIIQWNFPSNDWHTPNAEADLKDGGNFLFRMETKDGSMGFDHGGTYDKIITNTLIQYTVSDGRKSTIEFIPTGDSTLIIETFDAELVTPIDMQREFCLGVLNSFKKYAERVSE